jgi:hypothetical protein
VVLAAHLLWQMWTETAADEHFWKAVVILVSILCISISAKMFFF